MLQPPIYNIYTYQQILHDQQDHNIILLSYHPLNAASLISMPKFSFAMSFKLR